MSAFESFGKELPRTARFEQIGVIQNPAHSHLTLGRSIEWAGSTARLLSFLFLREA